MVICDVLLLHLLSFQISFTHPNENEDFILDSDGHSLYSAFDDISSGESGASGNEDEGSGSGQQPLGLRLYFCASYAWVFWLHLPFRHFYPLLDKYSPDSFADFASSGVMVLPNIAL